MVFNNGKYTCEFIDFVRRAGGTHIQRTRTYVVADYDEDWRLKFVYSNKYAARKLDGCSRNEKTTCCNGKFKSPERTQVYLL